MENLKKGDVVKLASGGPLMTVTYVSPDGKIECWWFQTSSHEKPSWATFPKEALIPAK